MKVVFTGGGTGGHFYPLIAVAEALQEIVTERHLVTPKLYFMAPKPFDEEALFQRNIVFVKNGAGKMRRYFSLRNVTDIFVTIAGFAQALITLTKLYPDVVFSKGGYASVPVVLAAWVLRIPIIIHESDSKPGRANLFAAKFAYRIGIAFESSASYFPVKARGKIAKVGIPVRQDVARVEREGAHQLLGLDPAVPTILILGGSLGSQRINETVLAALPELVAFANVIHQTGKDHFQAMQRTAPVALQGSAHADRYHAFPYLNSESMRRAAGAANVVISRAGATSITEISLWHTPAILIPIPENVSHDQRSNAYAYARTGAAVVLEEGNLTPNLLASEARRLALDTATAESMVAASTTFATADAARIIADEITAIALSHESPDNPPAA
ncbi:MAG TPA: UDP-N-acetylglucosamine--N-acetylmuramyl-(pentapeptide) pyrophosphoryl-undecaprenol N-acetylglucosamine transferase [Candidatus Paceibacterota bacterium]|nr:UDP-N-acetylglucosamine--N-acetylmuramyl-(pentapeptide) pyrophosphoryl-undecaprenol N-acetylglucosamine transferase [Candidatus Paceibacterota bacterium]